MFTDEEKVRIRHHLGYLNVQVASTFFLGVPAGVETQYLVESAMDRVLPAAESMARELIGKCDAVEAQMLENQELLAVSQVDEIQVRPDEFQQLKRRYDYWRGALANVLGTIVNPFDKRFAGGGINLRVNHA